MRARYYSPLLCRFINADIVAGNISDAVTLNRFAYANGNPVSNIDPFGLSVDNRMSFDFGFSAPDSPAAAFGRWLGGFIAENASDWLNAIIPLIETDEFKTLKAGSKMALGIWDIAIGVGYLLAPVPTPAEDILGVRKITFGMVKAALGLAQFLGEVLK